MHLPSSLTSTLHDLTMLMPLYNAFRSFQDLSGLWKFRIDPDDQGEREGWFRGFSSDLDVAVPGSWNEQLEELGLLNYVGSAWYSTRVFVPQNVAGQRVVLRVGSADYIATVWINGTLAGSNDLGFLPFEVPATELLKFGTWNDVIIRVDNRLSLDGIPQGITSSHYEREQRLREETFPPSRFDFFPFGGIHRPVHLVVMPPNHIHTVRVDTTFKGRGASVQLHVEVEGEDVHEVSAEVLGGTTIAVGKGRVKDGVAEFEIHVEDARRWSPQDPFLYQLTLHALNGAGPLDLYSLNIGIREIRIEGDRLLLNGEPIYLKGFGRHEDSPVIGKGLSLALMVKDFGLMRWVNANSFRTSHYPYAEEVMAYADAKGFLVIDEVPAVSLDWRSVTPATLERHQEYIRRLVARDYNHPSVILWALGNEPNLVGEPTYYDGRGERYWKQIFETARSLDHTRPMLVPNCLRAGIEDPILAFSDIVAINRYYGWYEYPGQMDLAIKTLNDEMEQLRARYHKPFMMTEFGVDTVPGLHATSDQMFTEEYQIRYLEQYIALLRSKSYVIGEHVWNFADFRTPQNLRRIVLNLKGVFTRTRTPKAAAFRLRDLWADVAKEPWA